SMRVRLFGDVLTNLVSVPDYGPLQHVSIFQVQVCLPRSCCPSLHAETPSSRWQRRLGCWRFSGSRIDDRADLEHLIGGKSTPSSVLANQVGAGGDVHTGDFVAGDVTLHPLDLRTHLLQYATGGLGDGSQLIFRQRTRSGNLPFDEILRHVDLLWGRAWG